MQYGEHPTLNVEPRLVKLASTEKREKWKKRKVKYLDKIPVSGKTPKTPEKFKKWSSLESFPKILKNNKYYLKIFSEIDFQKFDPIFKIKILKSTVDTGLHRVGRIFDKIWKISENAWKEKI